MPNTIPAIMLVSDLYADFICSFLIIIIIITTYTVYWCMNVYFFSVCLYTYIVCLNGRLTTLLNAV